MQIYWVRTVAFQLVDAMAAAMVDAMVHAVVVAMVDDNT